MMEEYVQIGSDLCKLMPTVELRWLHKRTASETSMTLQQKWTATGRLQDGCGWTEERWIAVPSESADK